MALELSLYDLVVDDLILRQRDLKSELKERFKRTKPFRMEKVDPAEMLYEYNTMTPDRMNSLIQTYGRDAMNELVFSMETLKKKMGGA